MQAQVFLSHSSDDQATAAEICRRLESRGVVCWVAPRDVAPGADYGEQIIQAIEGTRVTVLVLSDPANRSTFVKNEIERAISKGKPVIPFRISDVQPSQALELFISRSQWIDGWAPPLGARVDVLANAIQGLLSLSDEPTPLAAPMHVARTTPPGSRRGFRIGAAIGLAVAALLLVVGGIVVGSGALNASPAAQRKTVAIPATALNGVPVTTVSAGQRVTLSASGVWCFGVSITSNQPICGSANGVYPHLDTEPVLVPSSDFGTLVAKVGDGDWFAVGASKDWVVETPGLLTLSFNDRTDGAIHWADNSGSVSVEVTIAGR